MMYLVSKLIGLKTVKQYTKLCAVMVCIDIWLRTIGLAIELICLLLVEVYYWFENVNGVGRGNLTRYSYQSFLTKQLIILVKPVISLTEYPTIPLLLKLLIKLNFN